MWKFVKTLSSRITSCQSLPHKVTSQSQSGPFIIHVLRRIGHTYSHTHMCAISHACVIIASSPSCRFLQLSSHSHAHTKHGNYNVTMIREMLTKIRCKRKKKKKKELIKMKLYGKNYSNRRGESK